MHCKFLKLTNGDDLIVQTDDKMDSLSKEFVDVVDPVLISSLQIPRGNMVIETYVMQPWIKMAKTEIVQIPTRCIVVAADVHELAEKQYFKYVEEQNNKTTVTEAIELDEEDLEDLDDDEELEDYIKDLIETEDVNDGYPRTKSGKTIH